MVAPSSPAFPFFYRSKLGFSIIAPNAASTRYGPQPESNFGLHSLRPGIDGHTTRKASTARRLGRDRISWGTDNRQRTQ